MYNSCIYKEHETFLLAPRILAVLNTLTSLPKYWKKKVLLYSVVYTDSTMRMQMFV